MKTLAALKFGSQSSLTRREKMMCYNSESIDLVLQCSFLINHRDLFSHGLESFSTWR
jgi:hypothetical protein